MELAIAAAVILVIAITAAAVIKLYYSRHKKSQQRRTLRYIHQPYRDDVRRMRPRHRSKQNPDH